MSFPDHHPSSSFMLSPPSFAADDDSNGGWPQFPINNEHFDLHSTFDQFPVFKRARISENNHFNNPMPFPPMNNSRMHHPQNPPSNRVGTSHIFFKTRMCAKFKMGMCRNGENCNFAHGVEDMRQPPPNWQELIGLREEEQRPSGNWDDDQKIIHKMKLCKKYYNGEQCPYGERCNFLHEDPSKFRDDAGRCRESSAISLVANGSPKSHLNGSNNSDTNVNTGSDGSIRPNGKAPFFKTKLCTKWETTGHCPFADKCHFAHGQAELQGPIGQAEGVGSFPASTRATSVPVNDASPTNTASVPDSNEDEQNKKSLLKWKVNKKINRIYADWLDDVPLPR